VRRFVLGGVGLAAILALVSVAWIRLAPIDAAGWHVDPVSAPVTGQANSWRVGVAPDAGVDAVSTVYGVPADELAQRVDAVALADDSTKRIAGGPEELWTTYVQRSPMMRFPDFVTVRVLPREEGGAALAIWSRSQYGRDDLGVNRARVERWLEELVALEE
jgi:hypothetical protein